MIYRKTFGKPRLPRKLKKANKKFTILSKQNAKIISGCYNIVAELTKLAKAHIDYKQDKIPTWNYNSDGKTYTHEVEFTIPNETRPFWEQLGYKTYEDYENSLIIIDMKTGKQYNFNNSKQLL
jgi:hypothetical protein